MDNVPDYAEMPVLVGISNPLRLVARDGNDSWSVTLDDVNRTSYNWVKLNRVSGGFDGNIAPFAMLVCFDGSLVIPALPEFLDKQRAVEVFNRVLAELLLGGVYTEAVVPLDVCNGVILPTGYVRISTPGGGAASRLHASLRSGEASSVDSVVLLGTTPTPIRDFESAVARGRAILSGVPKLSPELLLAGITHYVREQWSEALVTTWTTTEQLISHLWEENVRASVTDPSIPGRKNFLSDYRTWPVSTRIEVLFQKGIVDESLYRELDSARKARNAFIHDGRVPGASAVESAVNGMFDLLGRCSKSTAGEADVARAKAMVVDKAKPEMFDAAQAIAWRHIRHLPGEKGWKGEFERFDLGFKPLEEIQPERRRKVSRKK